MSAMKLCWGRKLAERIAAELTPFCDRIEIAGSIRRQRPVVNDIDLVVLPKQGSFYALQERCKQHSKVVTSGEQNQIYRLANGEQLDLWIARWPSQDLLTRTPTTFGTLLLCRTGSKEHNIYLCQRAESLGMRWNPYHGVFEHGRCIACETEEEIFTTLQLDFVEPEKREK